MRTLVLVALIACARDAPKPIEEAWGTAEYATAGIPDPGHPWTAAELTSAVDALGRASAGHPERLPQFHGARSGAVFARMAETLADDPSASVTERFGARAGRYGALNAASKLYMRDIYMAPPREVIELWGALLREAAALEPLIAPFMATFGPDDPKHDVRMDGLAKMHHGTGELIHGGTLVAADLRVPIPDRVALLGFIAAVLPSLFAVVPADSQAAIRDQLAKLVEASSGAIHDAALAAQHAIPH